MSRFTIEPSTIPGQWMALDNGVPMRTDGKLWLFGSAAAASNWIDENTAQPEWPERHVPLSGPSRAGRQHIGDCSGPADARMVPYDTGVMHGPTAYIVRRNGTGAALSAHGDYASAYAWCVRYGLNGIGELLDIEPGVRVAVHIDPPRRYR